MSTEDFSGTGEQEKYNESDQEGQEQELYENFSDNGEQEKYNESDQEGQEQELYEHYRYVVDPGQSMLRIDKYLSRRMENVSRTRVQAAARAGNILVNDSPVRSNYRVKPLDLIQVLLPNPPREIELIPGYPHLCCL